eukprot:TRINITY_DN104593_c0_g1_i1.p1 TRINITY_DN104593_c0_g1~~TRINITY_DN104593_c0_g1_i1.p1  ORF type:complete len:555 (+),score=93.28 TRINITY_DN104593_c0_g1_i1:137-1801(+)
MFSAKSPEMLPSESPDPSEHRRGEDLSVMVMGHVNLKATIRNGEQASFDIDMLSPTSQASSEGDYGTAFLKHHRGNGDKTAVVGVQVATQNSKSLVSGHLSWGEEKARANEIDKRLILDSGAKPAASRNPGLLPDMATSGANGVSSFAELPDWLLYALEMGAFGDEDEDDDDHEEGSCPAGKFKLLDARSTTFGHQGMNDILAGLVPVDIALILLDGFSTIHQLKRMRGPKFVRDEILTDHISIVAAMGVSHVVVAVSGTWRSSNLQSFLMVKSLVEEHLSERGFDPGKVPIISVQEDVLNACVMVEWNSSPDLLTVLRKCPPVVAHLEDQPLRAPIQDIYKRSGSEVVVVVRIEMGKLKRNDRLVMSPGQHLFAISHLEADGRMVEQAFPGDVVSLVGAHVFSEAIYAEDNDNELPCPTLGAVISLRSREPAQECKCVCAFLTVLAQPSKAKLCKGYKGVLDAHTAHVPCEIESCNWRRGRRSPDSRVKSPEALEVGDVAEVWLVPLEPICLEVFRSCPGLGRIALRDAGITVAAGVVSDIRRVKREEAYFGD